MEIKKPKKSLRQPQKAKEFHKQQVVELPEKVSADLELNLAALDKMFGDNLDFIIRQMNVGPTGQLRIAIVFLETLTDKVFMSEYILEPISRIAFQREDIIHHPQRLIENFPSAIKIKAESDWKEMIKAFVNGHALLFIDGYDQATVMEIRMWKERAVSEPSSESVVVGPREGFVESVITNVSLLRRRLRTHNLMMEAHPTGTTSNTTVVITYLRGVADEKMVEGVRQQLKKVNVEAIHSENVINEVITPVKGTPFQMYSGTERPDKLAAALLEGRVGLLTDNSPRALIIPTVFWQFFQSSEDYYEHFPLAALNRFLRMAAFFVVVGFTAFYVAITTFHHEMVPTTLILSMAAVRQPVPFPTAVEALFLEAILEALREAGLRLPKPAGQAVSIVGALVMGQAAVEAGLVTPQLVIVVALAGIASFIIPEYSFVIALRVLKFGFIILASLFGIYGLMIGYLLLAIHLSSLTCFGVPYLSPVTPFKLKDMKDIFIRAPWWAMGKRGPSDLGNDKGVGDE